MFLHEHKIEGYTPVRRRLSTINTRQLQGDSEKEWTAARCNRLLRALQSRVAILKKELSRIQPEVRGRGTAIGVKSKTVRKADPDTDWNQARKKIKRTYSTRGGRSNSDARASQRMQKLQAAKDTRPYIPGEVLVPTPILNRARGAVASMNSSIVPPLAIEEQEIRPNKRTKAKDVQSNSRLSQTLRGIRKLVPASRYAVYEGIYNGLETLLKATAPGESQRIRTGSKSLLSLCLRTIPQYIASEEKQSMAYAEETKSKSAIDSRDISSEVYDDLEAFGCNGKGWRHFRTIVRSHGMQLVCDAIRARSLDTEFIGILITQCIHAKATEEAEILLSAMLSTTEFPAPKSVFTRSDDEPATRPLSMLWKFVEITGCFSFQYRQLSMLISSGCLPLSWLATKELGPVWTRALQALPTASNGTGADALLFMDTVLPLLAQADDLPWGEQRTVKADSLMIDAMKQTFASLLTTLCSIVTLSRDTAKSLDRKTHAYTTEYTHFVDLIWSSLLQWELSRISSIQGTLLVITNLILGKVDPESPESSCDLVYVLFNHLRRIDKSSSVLPPYHEIVSFICSIARCCGRGASNSGFEYLENLHQKFETLICNCDPDRANVLREILADSALAFAQEIPDRKYLDYADAMEAKAHRVETKSTVSFTPGHSSDNSRVGFRWEEGISEWVTTTPLSTNRCEIVSNFLRAHQPEYETPFRPARQRKFKKPNLPHTRNRVVQSSAGIMTSGSRLHPEPVESSPASELPAPGFGDVHDANGTDFEIDSTDDDKSEDVPMGHSPDSPLSTGDSGSESMEQDHEGSSEDLQSSSPQSDSSNDWEQISFPQNKNSWVDESVTSVSSADSMRSKKPGSGRRHIDRVPRLSRRVLRHSLQWQLFDDDESDDELSFISVSSEGGSILQDITNSVIPKARRELQTNSAPKRKPVRVFGDTFLGGSEDELCI